MAWGWGRVLGTGLLRGSLADGSCPFSCWCDLHSAWGAAQAVVAANLIPEQSPVHPDGAAGSASCAPERGMDRCVSMGQGPMCSSGEAGFAHMSKSKVSVALPSEHITSPWLLAWKAQVSTGHHGKIMLHLR